MISKSTRFRLTSVRTLSFDVNQMRISRYEELYERIGNCPDGTCVIPGTSILLKSLCCDAFDAENI